VLQQPKHPTGYVVVNDHLQQLFAYILNLITLLADIKALKQCLHRRRQSFWCSLRG